MSTLIFSRSEGSTMIRLGDSERELTSEQLISLLSSLTTDGGSFCIDLPDDRELDEAVVSSPTPLSIGSQIGSVRNNTSVVSKRPPPWKGENRQDERITRSAYKWIRKLGMREADVLRIVDEESYDDEWVTNDGRVCILVKGDLAVSVAMDNDQVLGVFSAIDAYNRFPREQTQDRRHGRGGSGHLYPNSVRDLLRLLESRGISVEKGGGGHYKLMNPEGMTCSIPATPSDHRSLMNNIKLLERVLGIDLRVR